MTFTIEFFRRTAGDPQGEPIGGALQDFSSRRAARIVAERNHPRDADGFRIYQDGRLLISVDLNVRRSDGASHDPEPARLETPASQPAPPRAGVSEA